MVREEIENKRIIGTLTFDSMFLYRLALINTQKQTTFHFSDTYTEDNFFKLINFLVYNCTENARMLRRNGQSVQEQYIMNQ